MESPNSLVWPNALYGNVQKDVVLAENDDALDTLKPLDKKIAELRAVFVKIKAELDALEYAFKWRTSEDFSKLERIDAEMCALAERSFGPSGVLRQLPCQTDKARAFTLFIDAKVLESEIMQAAKVVKTLKRFTASAHERARFQEYAQVKLKKYETDLPPVVEEEADSVEEEQKNPEYGLWSRIPRHLYGYSTVLSYTPLMGGDPYKQASELAAKLELKVGQKIWRFVERLDVRINEFSASQVVSPDDWKALRTGLAEDGENLKELYKQFRLLSSRLDALPDDKFTPYVRSYAHGLLYMLFEAKRKLNRLAARTEERAFYCLKVINGTRQLFEGGELVVNRLLELYNVHMLLQDVDAYDEKPNSFHRFLSRIHNELREFFVALGHEAVELTEQEEQAKAMVLSKTYPAEAKEKMMPPEITTYLAKRMVAACLFPLQDGIDVELELVCSAIIADRDLSRHYYSLHHKHKGFEPIITAYDRMFKERRQMIAKELHEGVRLACDALSVKDINGYMHVAERLAVFASRWSKEAYPVLATIGSYLKRDGYPLFYPRIDRADIRFWAVREPKELFLQLSEIEDHASGTLQQFFESLVFRLLSSAFHGERIAKVTAQIQLAGLYNNSAYESHFRQLSSQVKALVNNNSINKLLDYRFEMQPKKSAILTDMEMKLLEEGPIKDLFEGKLHPEEIPTWLYPLVKMEKLFQAQDAISLFGRMKKRWSEQDIANWYDYHELKHPPQGDTIDQKSRQESRRKLLQEVRG